MSPTNDPVVLAAKSFAKATKISQAKALEFAKQIREIPHERNLTKRTRIAGERKPRKISDESLKIRETVRKLAKENPGISVISSELALRLGVGPSALNNNMRALAEENIVQQVGELKDTGRRGRAPAIWKLLPVKE